MAVLTLVLPSSLFARDIVPVPRGRLLHLCVGNTWPDSGLVNPEGLMLCSHFLLLLSLAVASQRHSSSVISTCDWTKQFKGLRWFSISKIFYFTEFFFRSLAWTKPNSSCSWCSFKWAAQLPGATTREMVFHTQSLYFIHLNTFPFKYPFKFKKSLIYPLGKILIFSLTI